MIAKAFYKFWNQRNKSNRYSLKLKKLFKEVIELISEYPKIGKLTTQEHIRIKIVRDYVIIYEEFETEIHILSIWSSYQDPANIEL